jgi:predicted O-methyltransferase YrrM
LESTLILNRMARIPTYGLALVGMVRPSFLRFLPIWIQHGRHARGWLRVPDAFLLYRLASGRAGEGQIVEIGSAWGRSTICLGAGARRAGAERVTAIDPHTGDTWYLDEIGEGTIDSFTEFSANIAKADLNEWVTPVVMTSEAAAAALPDAPIRLLFIDGLHTLEGVERDIADWVPRVRDGGVIVFDDYDNTAEGVGVRTAVDRLLQSGKVDPTLRRAFNLVWTTRRSGAAETASP